MSLQAAPFAPRVLQPVRAAVRKVLSETAHFRDAPPELRRALAERMVRVSAMAADLIAADQKRAPLAQAADAGDHLSLKAAQAAPGQFKALEKAIDFPNFVTSLITGVFQSITSSNLQQLEAISDLLDNVAKTQQDFQASNIDDDGARQWAAQKFPFLKASDGTLDLVDGVDFEEKRATVKATLGISDSQAGSIDETDLDGTLLPLIQTKMSKDRQSILGTMVQMGLQRIVVDQGQLHASMDMRVDTSSAAQEEKDSRFDTRVSTSASGKFSMGMWGASAKLSATVGYVESDQNYTQEQLASRAALRSSVDLAFRTDQIPLDKVASKSARVKIDAAARVPAGVDDKSILSNETQLKPADFGKLPNPDSDAAAPAETKPKADQSKDKSKDQSKDQSKDKSKDQSKDQSKDGQSKDQNKGGQSKDQNKGGGQNKDQNKGGQSK